MTLVAYDPDVCPDCREVTSEHEWAQPALIRHAGYGATMRCLIRLCHACGWSLTKLVTEERPEREA